jgi:hypothetical protein
MQRRGMRMTRNAKRSTRRRFNRMNHLQEINFNKRGIRETKKYSRVKINRLRITT